MKLKKRTKEAQYKFALEQIAHLGAGLKPEVIDWQNIGKNAVAMAKSGLYETCEKCGQVIHK
jgi:hypothetical protein